MMSSRSYILLLNATVLWLSTGWTTLNSADNILGKWFFPARQSTVEVYRNEGRYYGRIVAVGEAYQDKVAENKLLFVGLTFDGKEWSGGKLIHPATGTEYDVALQLKSPQTMDVTVYKGIRCLNRNFKLVRQ